MTAWFVAFFQRSRCTCGNLHPRAFSASLGRASSIPAAPSCGCSASHIASHAIPRWRISFSPPETLFQRSHSHLSHPPYPHGMTLGPQRIQCRDEPVHEPRLHVTPVSGISPGHETGMGGRREGIGVVCWHLGLVRAGLALLEEVEEVLEMQADRRRAL